MGSPVLGPHCYIAHTSLALIETDVRNGFGS